MQIRDECINTDIKIEGICIGNDYIYLSDCNVNVNLKTIELLKEDQIITGKPYPNPASLKINLPFTKIADTLLFHECKIYNLLGNELYAGKLNILNKIKTGIYEIINCSYEFDTEKLQSGIYFIVFKSNNKNLSYPVVVQK
jgi:hypothetical protein